MASVISTQRSFVDYLLHCRKILPEFFQFEGLGILFRDQETGNLFTIEQDEQAEDNELLDARQKRKLTDSEVVADAER